MNPSRVRFTRSIELEDELIWREVCFYPIKKFSVVCTYHFEVCGLGLGVL
jgi:hypothetical protein